MYKQLLETALRYPEKSAILKGVRNISYRELVSRTNALARALVEIERYNAVVPKELPPDEQITRTAKTDPNGIFTCTLTEPGWWCLAATNP